MSGGDNMFKKRLKTYKVMGYEINEAATNE
ncbi:hypothetical protein MNBD_UNCLBAC01-55 [hydrothermal vent metagenome]|uniref:Uncharacterized protein n=1 Tax=hydrothermal vent metagenome TaxID=652676 RepID=A0A3B1DMN6_9ZZZZ